MTPSTEITFQVRAEPDSITVGDPIRVSLAVSAPARGHLVTPAPIDSVGSFAVLESGRGEPEEREGRQSVEQEITLTLFETGRHELPPLQVLWIPSPGETLFAMSSPLEITVGSVLPPGAQGPEHLRDLEDVIPLGRPVWPWVAAGALLLALALFLFLRRRKRRPRALAPAIPVLPPDREFEHRLDGLLERRLPEQGEMKQFYVELSQLLRAYLEARLGFLALEGTRAEVLDGLSADPRVTREDLAWIGPWLEAGDLVKFAKGERLVGDALRDAEEARAWVRAAEARWTRPPTLPARPPAEAGA